LRSEVKIQSTNWKIFRLIWEESIHNIEGRVPKSDTTWIQRKKTNNVPFFKFFLFKFVNEKNEKFQRDELKSTTIARYLNFSVSTVYFFIKNWKSLLLQLNKVSRGFVWVVDMFFSWKKSNSWIIETSFSSRVQ
jgi:hypothetical protein